MRIYAKELTGDDNDRNEGRHPDTRERHIGNPFQGIAEIDYCSIRWTVVTVWPESWVLAEAIEHNKRINSRGCLKHKSDIEDCQIRSDQSPLLEDGS